MHRKYTTTHEEYMQKAILLAQKAAENDEIPIGAIIIKNSKIIGKGFNQVRNLKDPTAHAEIIAITSACNTIENFRLTDCNLYVTKEPCVMCAGAIVNARLKNVFFGSYDPEYGACSSLYNICNDPCLNHRCGIKGGILDEKCSAILDLFFAGLRLKN